MPPTSVLGERIGSYRVVSMLGAGGMAEVYIGEHIDPSQPQRVAIKALLPEFCQDQVVVERFMNEAKALAAIRHPGVVEVYEVGRLTGGRVCLVMELLRGETLATRLARQGRLPPDEAVVIAIQVARAMEAAHQARIIHRDLKPHNIFVNLERHGLEARVIDFGVAKLLDGYSEVETLTRSTLGTAAYMAPEQCRSAKDVDARADVYALGCMLFEMLVGQPPFSAKNLLQQMDAHMNAPIPATGVSPALDALLRRALAKDREQRFSSMREMAAALLATSQGAGMSDDVDTQRETNKRRPRPTEVVPKKDISAMTALIIVAAVVAVTVMLAIALN